MGTGIVHPLHCSAASSQPFYVPQVRNEGSFIFQIHEAAGLVCDLGGSGGEVAGGNLVLYLILQIARQTPGKAKNYSVALNQGRNSSLHPDGRQAPPPQAPRTSVLSHFPLLCLERFSPAGLFAGRCPC